MVVISELWNPSSSSSHNSDSWKHVHIVLYEWRNMDVEFSQHFLLDILTLILYEDKGIFFLFGMEFTYFSPVLLTRLCVAVVKSCNVADMRPRKIILVFDRVNYAYETEIYECDKITSIINHVVCTAVLFLWPRRATRDTWNEIHILQKFAYSEYFKEYESVSVNPNPKFWNRYWVHLASLFNPLSRLCASTSSNNRIKNI